MYIHSGKCLKEERRKACFYSETSCCVSTTPYFIVWKLYCMMWMQLDVVCITMRKLHSGYLVPAVAEINCCSGVLFNGDLCGIVAQFFETCDCGNGRTIKIICPNKLFLQWRKWYDLYIYGNRCSDDKRGLLLRYNALYVSNKMTEASVWLGHSFPTSAN